MYALFLKQLGCHIAEAADGREALAKALSRQPDVIITETRLSGIGGFDLCALLRHDATTQDVPIVVLTGDAFEVDVKRAELVGADTVLTKPCLPQALADEIRRLLHQSRELRARARDLRGRGQDAIQKSDDLHDRSQAHRARREMLSHTFQRCDTTEPPIQPPALVCPQCDSPLKYLRSHVGGVSIRHPEQWDYFECLAGCGTFQYRQRTRRLRAV